MIGTIVAVVLTIIIILLGLLFSKNKTPKDTLPSDFESDTASISTTDKKFSIYYDEKRRKVEELENKWDEIYPDADKLYCEVKGIFARSQAARDSVQYLDVGDFVNLKLEPTNEYDPFAVKVLFGNKHIGYIPADDSEEIHSHIEEGGNYIAFIEDTLDTYEDCYAKDLWLLIYLNKTNEEDSYLDDDDL